MQYYLERPSTFSSASGITKEPLSLPFVHRHQLPLVQTVASGEKLPAAVSFAKDISPPISPGSHLQKTLCGELHSTKQTEPLTATLTFDESRRCNSATISDPVPLPFESSLWAEYMMAENNGFEHGVLPVTEPDDDGALLSQLDEQYFNNFLNGFLESQDLDIGTMTSSGEGTFPNELNGLGRNSAIDSAGSSNFPVEDQGYSNRKGKLPLRDDPRNSNSSPYTLGSDTVVKGTAFSSTAINLQQSTSTFQGSINPIPPAVSRPQLDPASTSFPQRSIPPPPKPSSTESHSSPFVPGPQTQHIPQILPSAPIQQRRLSLPISTLAISHPAHLQPIAVAPSRRRPAGTSVSESLSKRVRIEAPSAGGNVSPHLLFVDDIGSSRRGLPKLRNETTVRRSSLSMVSPLSFQGIRVESHSSNDRTPPSTVSHQANNGPELQSFRSDGIAESSPEAFSRWNHAIQATEAVLQTQPRLSSANQMAERLPSPANPTHLTKGELSLITSQSPVPLGGSSSVSRPLAAIRGTFENNSHPAERGGGISTNTTPQAARQILNTSTFYSSIPQPSNNQPPVRWTDRTDADDSDAETLSSPEHHRSLETASFPKSQPVEQLSIREAQPSLLAAATVAGASPSPSTSSSKPSLDSYLRQPGSTVSANGEAEGAMVPAAVGGPGRGRRSGKELLTEEEKRTNHILSEQRRRNVIRNGFQTLAELVPSLGVCIGGSSGGGTGGIGSGTGMGKSKSVILTRTAEYIRTIEEQNRRLQETLSGLEVRVEEKRRAMYAGVSGEARGVGERKSHQAAIQGGSSGGTARR